MAKRFERDKDEKIRLIYDAFTKLVNARGYEGVTTRRIADEAGISVGIIYHYFPEGKPAIAAKYYEKNFLKIMDPDAFLGRDPDRLEIQIRDHLRIHRENIELYRAFDQAILTNHDLFQNLKKERRDLLETQIEEKGLSDEAVEACLTAYNLIDAVIHRHLFVDPISKTDKGLVEFLTKLLTLTLEHGLLD
jgi:AcrR family transcriptional regulator